jgi:hypothetical protein
MRLSFIGSEHHILSDCIRESRFQGVRQLFSNSDYKFNDPVLDVYCPSDLKPVAFGDFILTERKTPTDSQVGDISEIN